MVWLVECRCCDSGMLAGNWRHRCCGRIPGALGRPAFSPQRASSTSPKPATASCTSLLARRFCMRELLWRSSPGCGKLGRRPGTATSMASSQFLSTPTRAFFQAIQPEIPHSPLLPPSTKRIDCARMTGNANCGTLGSGPSILGFACSSETRQPVRSQISRRPVEAGKASPRSLGASSYCLVDSTFGLASLAHVSCPSSLGLRPASNSFRLNSPPLC